MITKNLIIVYGGSYNQIKQALRDWINLYSSELNADLAFELSKDGRGKYVIKTDASLNDEQFYYLVNYLHYPEGIEYKVRAEGFFVAKDSNELCNQRLMVYIPEEEKGCDNVFVVAEDNSTSKISFGLSGIKITRSETFRAFKLPFVSSNLSGEQVRFNKNASEETRRKKFDESIDTRFRIVSLVVVLLVVVNSVIAFKNPVLFSQINFFLGMSLGVWLFGDYKMLRVDKYYLYCFGISLAFLLYCALAKNIFSHLQFEDVGPLYPLSVLVVQKPLRLLFKASLNREPVVDKPPPTFWDGVYSVALLLSVAFLPLLIADLLK